MTEGAELLELVDPGKTASDNKNIKILDVGTGVGSVCYGVITIREPVMIKCCCMLVICHRSHYDCAKSLLCNRLLRNQ